MCKGRGIKKDVIVYKKRKSFLLKSVYSYTLKWWRRVRSLFCIGNI